MASSVLKDEDVSIPMRDGVITRADVYRPAASRSPVLLARQAFSKRLPYDQGALSLDPAKLAQRGYAVVVQDVRGTHSADGSEYVPYFHEIDDGYDSVEWCAAQPWSDGRVGMFGRSQVGLHQWLAAIARPPSLVAIAPLISSGNPRVWAYQDGAFQLGWSLWFALTLVRNQIERLASSHHAPEELRARVAQLTQNQMAALNRLPLRELEELRDVAPYYFDWLDHPDDDSYWQRADPRQSYSQLDIATLNVGGWFDVFVRGTIADYSGMATAPSIRSRRSRLVIGPWAHNAPLRPYSGEMNFGPSASEQAFDLDTLQYRFFDYWLRGIDRGFSSERPVQIFVMGANEWRSEEEWPLPQADTMRYFIRSGGKANSAAGDGFLSRDPPTEETPDLFIYDPKDPVPTRGGAVVMHGLVPQGPIDQRRLERRTDILVYTSVPLDSELEVTGEVRFALWAVTTARDTDFTAKLVDVYPDGRALSIADGIVRARYHKTSLEQIHLRPGEPECFTVDLGPTSLVFKRDHQIRLEVSSSNFPRFDRNLNTGESQASGSVGRPALQLILHSSKFPSHLLLPVIR